MLFTLKLKFVSSKKLDQYPSKFCGFYTMSVVTLQELLDLMKKFLQYKYSNYKINQYLSKKDFWYQWGKN